MYIQCAYVIYNTYVCIYVYNTYISHMCVCMYMYVCMYIYIHYMYVHTYICIYMYIYMSIYVNICIYMYIHIHACVCMHIHTYTYLYICSLYVRMHACMCVCMCVCTHTHMYIHIYIYTYIWFIFTQRSSTWGPSQLSMLTRNVFCYYRMWSPTTACVVAEYLRAQPALFAHLIISNARAVAAAGGIVAHIKVSLSRPPTFLFIYIYV